MRVIVCLDDKNGMMFNKRRQSRDRVVVQDILATTIGKKLWMNNYSAKIFEEKSENICVDEDFLFKSQQGEYCFVENQGLSGYEEQIEEVIVYRWGRIYPSDVQLDIDLANGTYALTSESELTGHSHPEMKRQVYVKKGV